MGLKLPSERGTLKALSEGGRRRRHVARLHGQIRRDPRAGTSLAGSIAQMHKTSVCLFNVPNGSKWDPLAAVKDVVLLTGTAHPDTVARHTPHRGGAACCADLSREKEPRLARHEPRCRLCRAVGKNVKRLAEEGRRVEPEVGDTEAAPTLCARLAVVRALDARRDLAVEPVAADRTPALPRDKQFALLADIRPALTPRP